MAEQTQTQALEQLYNRKRELEEFLAHPIYLELVGAIEAIVRSRRQGVFNTEMTGLESAFAVCKAQAEIAGLMLAKALIPMTLDDVQVDIMSRLEDERKDTEQDG